MPIRGDCDVASAAATPAVSTCAGLGRSMMAAMQDEEAEEELAAAVAMSGGQLTGIDAGLAGHNDERPEVGGASRSSNRIVAGAAMRVKTSSRCSGFSVAKSR